MITNLIANSGFMVKVTGLGKLNTSTMREKIIIHWFRNDLRIADNPGLTAAHQLASLAGQEVRVVPLYIMETPADDYVALGGASRWWLHHSLQSLNHTLDGSLLLSQGDPLTIFEQLSERFQLIAVTWNRVYEAWRIKRDTALKEWLAGQGIEVKSCNGSLLWEPMSILKKDQTPYKVFTPFYRKGCLAAAAPRMPIAAQTEKRWLQVEDSMSLADLELLPKIRWDATMQDQWQVGEAAAQEKLQSFIQQSVLHYKEQRDFPSIAGTSRLSAHLHFGELSPHQCWYAVVNACQGRVEDRNIDGFLSELGWREFNYYLMFHFGDLQRENFNRKFDHFPWLSATDDLSRWQHGNTGIPIVDAGMRELWQTGYMHNRVRMIVASFLVKNLLLDWRHGERWFWDCLLDADMASNSAGWQWAAGSGADAAPYFRVFNPVLQGEKFDKQGAYVKTYCPELTKVPDKYIHKPWEMPQPISQHINFVLGRDYPEPIVDLKASRERALAAFQQLKAIEA